MRLSEKLILILMVLVLALMVQNYIGESIKYCFSNTAMKIERVASDGR
jgi:hypothetical protein